MKQLMTVLALAAAAISTSAYATSHKEGADMTKQQGKMASCNKEAGDKKGDERKAFMKTCLSAQQDKMKSCNADAKGKTGDERKAFMKECLSK
jgi:hypothetical protein